MSQQRPRRAYDATGRRRAAAERRERIVAVAAELFARDGWSATTVQRIAEGAGVSSELVLSAFGSKGALAMAALRHVSFGAADVDLPTAFAALGLPSLPRAERVDVIVEFACRSLVPMAPLEPVLISAADQDAVAALAVADGQHRHLLACRALVSALVDDPEAEPDPVLVDEVYLLTTAATFLVLTAERGWSVEEYGAWLRRSLCRLFEITGA